jgi:HD-like signal output (HDOD) protein
MVELSGGERGRGPVSQMSLPERVRHTLTKLSATGELPALPGVATAALRVARDPDADLDEICRAIQTDVGIAARVVRMANSAVYARRTVCRTLRDAVLTVGLRTMSDILMGASLRSLYGGRHPLAQRLWDHALATALACEEVAAMTRAVARGTTFLPGLFHDVGRIAFLLADPMPLEVVAGLVAHGHGTWTELETEWYGFDHAAAGATLAEDWGLPIETCEAIRCHHEPAAATAGRTLAEVIAIADAVVYRLDLGAGGIAAPPVEQPGVPFGPADVEACAERTRAAFQAQRAAFA